jgi:hypothetical protein
LWNLHPENISFRLKVIPINVLENTCPGFKTSPSKIDKQHTLYVAGQYFSNGGKPGQVFSVL